MVRNQAAGLTRTYGRTGSHGHKFLVELAGCGLGEGQKFESFEKDEPDYSLYIYIHQEAFPRPNP